MTIPEAVRLQRKNDDGPYIKSRIREVAPISFEDAVAQADLIVHGSLRKIASYLSSDLRTLYTDYEGLPIEIISSRSVQAASKPGVARPFVLRQWGGETTIEGVPVRIFDENFPPLPVGQPMLLLLSRERSTGKYEIAGAIAGAFALDAEGKLRHLAKPAVAYYGAYDGMELARAIAQVRDIEARRRR